MIKALRIDERLIHGQVVVSWCTALQLTTIVVANDAAANDEIASMTLKMAVPHTVKVAIKTIAEAIELLHDPRCDALTLLVIVKNPGDAIKMLEGVPAIPFVYVGNYGQFGDATGNRVKLSTSLVVNEEEKEQLKKIVELRPDTVYQMVAIQQPVLLKSLIN